MRFSKFARLWTSQFSAMCSWLAAEASGNFRLGAAVVAILVSGILISCVPSSWEFVVIATLRGFEWLVARRLSLQPTACAMLGAPRLQESSGDSGTSCLLSVGFWAMGMGSNNQPNDAGSTSNGRNQPSPMGSTTNARNQPNDARTREHLALNTYKQQKLNLMKTFRSKLKIDEGLNSVRWKPRRLGCVSSLVSSHLGTPIRRNLEIRIVEWVYNRLSFL